jgi:hypothetical protein
MPLTNEQARQGWRDSGNPCVADAHKPERKGDRAICRICGDSVPVAPEPADSAPVTPLNQ